jgi:hypothetical protein
MVHKITLLLAIIFVQGCAPVIKDFDAGKIEREKVAQIKQIQLLKPVPTPDFVRVADEDGVIVEVIKLKPIKGRAGINLDVWSINVSNKSDEPKCVAIDWKLMDFELETSLPYDFLVLDNETIKLGRMKQTIWSFDDNAIALPPSGYVERMRVRDASFEKTTNTLTCETLESDIQEPKD